MNVAPTLQLVLMQALTGNPRQLEKGDKGQGRVNEFHQCGLEWERGTAAPRQQPVGVEGVLKGLQGIQDGLNLGCQGRAEGEREKKKDGVLNTRLGHYQGQ